MDDPPQAGDRRNPLRGSGVQGQIGGDPGVYRRRHRLNRTYRDRSQQDRDSVDAGAAKGVEALRGLAGAFKVESVSQERPAQRREVGGDDDDAGIALGRPEDRFIIDSAIRGDIGTASPSVA